LRDACANLAHDLLDVDVIARRLRLFLGRRVTTVVAASVGTAAASMEVGPTAVLRVLISHYSMPNAQCPMPKILKARRNAPDPLGIEH
jgi:hypothetical protein